MLERDGKDVSTRCSEKWDRTRKATCSVQQLLESFKNKLHNIFGNFTYTFFKSNFTSKKRNSMKNILIRKVYALVCSIFKRSKYLWFLFTYVCVLCLRKSVKSVLPSTVSSTENTIYSIAKNTFHISKKNV